MVLVDGAGVPLGALLSSASPAEVKLAEQTLAEVKVPRRAAGRPKSKPMRVIADKAYDSNALRRRLAQRGIELIAPHRRNRRDRCQDGRALRRYRRRWKVERTFAWIGNFRRLVVRYERLVLVYRAFLYLACALIALRRLLRAAL
jgi:transposase